MQRQGYSAPSVCCVEVWQVSSKLMTYLPVDSVKNPKTMSPLSMDEIAVAMSCSFTEHHLVGSCDDKRLLTHSFSGLCVFIHRSSGLGTGREGGHPAGAPPGGIEDLRKEEEASQTAHVPQDANEDH